MSRDVRPFTAANAIAFAAKLTVPDVTVKPFEAVNVFVQVIVVDVKAPVFVIDQDDKAPVFGIDPDDKAPVVVIVFDVKAPVLLMVFDVKAPILVIVFDVNVFKVDGPKTFNDDVSILSDCCVFVSNVVLLNVCGISLFGKSIEG